MKRDFYIYAHFKKTNNKLFYIGKGSGNRSNNKKNRNIYWKRIVSKHDYYIKIIKNNLSEKIAHKEEVFYIKHFKMIGCKLCNMTDGGEGVSGLKHSNLTKEILSKKGLGRKASKETKNKMALRMKGNKNSLGLKTSNETKLKLSNSSKNKKIVLQYDLKENFIKEWESVSYAAKALNINTSGIFNCITNKQSTCKGFKWKFK